MAEGGDIEVKVELDVDDTDEAAQRLSAAMESNYGWQEDVNCNSNLVDCDSAGPSVKVESQEEAGADPLALFEDDDDPGAFLFEAKNNYIIRCLGFWVLGQS